MPDNDVLLQQLHQSKFYQRLIAARDLPGVDVTALETTVKKVCEQVAAVTTRVSTYFHAYTLHDMSHLWNVIGIMEELIPDEVWETPWTKADDRIGPFQCALSLMAALVHDLGMAPPQDLTDKLELAEDLDQPIPSDADRDFVAYRRHYASSEDDVRTIRALLKKEGTTPAENTEVERRRQMIRTDYLRITHSDDTISGTSRIKNWLTRFQPESDYTYHGWPYLDLLDAVAMSHAHSGGLKWLEEQLGANSVENFGSEKASGLHVAWLLRLADILDLDASRAPAILYRNFPPNNTISHQHWMQHLCISNRVIDWLATAPTVTFRKGQPCRNPEIQKSLADYCGWSSAPVRFELSQQDVTKILMGEELYGESELCLREVIQNALDATHLRWLRYELRQRMVDRLGEEAYAKYDLPSADVSLNKDDLQIKVSWGVGNLPNDGWRPDTDDQADERHWIEIEDPGTGMTVDVVKKYFTQIGRSYYQSPEYRRDRALFNEYGLPASEISQFGIGILSCFMLADVVEVWTCPIRPHEPTENDRPHHYRIWGADGLFWHQPTDEKTSTGTRIRMWLKKDRTAACDFPDLHADLRNEHYDRRKASNSRIHIDPLREIWGCVPWPRYQIQFTDGEREELSRWSLDTTSHLDQLLLLDAQNVTEEYERITGTSQPEPLALQWAWFEWEHEITASRLRIAVPVVTKQNAGQCSDFGHLVDLLSACPATATGPSGTVFPYAVDKVLPDKTSRTQLLVRGLRVPELHVMLPDMPLAAHAGSILFVDFSGHTAPRLRADRKAATKRQRSDWPAELGCMFAAFTNRLTQQLTRNEPNKIERARVAETILRLSRTDWYRQAKIQFPKCSLVLIDPNASNLWLNILAKDAVRHRPLDASVKIGNECKRQRTHERDIALAHMYDYLIWLEPATNLKFAETLACICITVIAKSDRNCRKIFDNEIDRVIERGIAVNFEGDGSIDLILERESKRNRERAFRRLRESVNLPEVFANSLWGTLACVEAPLADGRGSDARMISPLQLEFQLTDDNTPPRTVAWESGWKDVPAWLNSKGYDLVAPWTQIPIGQLRDTCPAWQTERALRAIAILPFVFSSSLKWEGFEKVLAELDEKLGLSKVPDILMLLPGESILTLPFADWTRPKTKDNVTTAYWKLGERKVLWADGFHDRKSIQEHGKTIEDIIGLNVVW